MKNSIKVNPPSIPILIFTFFAAFSSVEAADPRLTYKLIETEHFEIIYDARQKQLALDYLVQAEKSYEVLQKTFNGVAPKKTVLFVDDTFDQTNGSATTLPRSTIIAYPVLPPAVSSLNHYGLWSQELVRHEYTHILNMEPTNGIWTPVRFLFGSLIRPNMLLPKWYLEGLAVELESRFTPFGRLRSSYYQAMIRSEVLNKTWGKQNISQINEIATPTWPRGQRPYFYGALLWHYMVHEKSPQLIGKLNEQYAGRFPFFLNGPIEDYFEKDYSGILLDAYSYYNVEAQDQIQQINTSSPPTKGSHIEVNKSFLNHSPEISPDGTKMVFVSNHVDGGTNIQLVEDDKSNFINGKPKSIASTTDTNRVSWFPDSKKIIYDKTDTFDRFYSFSDLYTYDLDAKIEVKMTDGLRATEPTVSPDGKQILFVKQEGGQTSLVAIDVDGKNFRTLYKPNPQVRISHPSYLRQDEIIFAQRDTNGDEYLYLIGANTKKPIRILGGFKQSKFPVVIKQGLVFVSEKTGVQNLYFSDMGFSGAHAITNSLTEVLNGTLDYERRKIYFSELTSQGYKLLMAQEPIHGLSLATIENQIAQDLPKEFAHDTNKYKIKNKDYSPLAYMFPQFWFPGFYAFSDGFIVSASTFSTDPVGIHTLGLGIDFDSRNSLPSGSINYVIQIGTGLLGIEGYTLNDYLPSFSTTSLTAGGDIFYKAYIGGLSNNWFQIFGWAYNYITNPMLTGEYLFQGPFYSVAYSDVSKKGFQISPVGKEFRVKYSYYLPNGTKTEHSNILATAAYYHTKWLPDYHTLYFGAQAFYSPRNRSILLGTMTLQAPYLIQLTVPQFVMRGYPTGEFMGWESYLGTIEYRFPLGYPYDGWGTFPIFWQKISLSIFGDFLNINGGYVDNNNSLVGAPKSKIYSSYGAELIFDINGFYHLPMALKVGYAFGTEALANGGSTFYLNLKL